MSPELPTSLPHAAVCIPWAGGDEHRTRAFEHAKAHYERLGYPVVTGVDDTPGEWVNRARCRNNAATSAILRYAPDVFVFADADTLVTHDQVVLAALAALASGRQVFAFDAYYRLNRVESRVLMRRGLDERSGELTKYRRPIRNISAAYAISREAWDAVGGYDERFVSWGGEDRAFWLACRALLGGGPTGEPEPAELRIPGSAYHLWHPTSPEHSERHEGWADMLALGRRYQVAAGWLSGDSFYERLGDDVPPDREALLALMREPGGPLAAVRA